MTKSKERTEQSFFSKYSSQIGLIIMVSLVVLFFIITSPNVFLKSSIYFSFLASVPTIGLMALGLTFILGLGEIDLSFPSVMALSGFLFATVFSATGSFWLALMACIGSGILVGMTNGFIVTKIGVPSIVVTLGMQFLVRGFSNLISNGTALILPLRGTVSQQILVGKIGKIPMQSLWFLGITIFLYFFLFRHKFGEHVLFVGDNQESARMMGVNVDWIKIGAFSLMGAMAAFAGIFDLYRMGTWWPTMGDGYLMMIMAAVFVGGTSMFGGEATIFGTFLGSFMIGALEAGIVAAGLKGFWTRFIIGVLIIIAVIIHTLIRKRK
ncbi:MAG: ABC transporter permease [Kosmotogaceae bacterium]